MPLNKCCCCRGNERCAFFIVKNATDAPPTPTITIAGASWTFNQNSFAVCSEACTGVIAGCGGTVTIAENISAVNGTYTGLPLAPLTSSAGEYGCTWQQAYAWNFGSTATDCGTLIPGGNPAIQCQSGASFTGGSIKLSVSASNQTISNAFGFEHTVSVDLELAGNVKIYSVASPTAGANDLGLLSIKWSTGLITVPKCPKTQPTIPPLVLVSTNLPASASSGSTAVAGCGTENSSSSAGIPGTATVKWA